MRGEQSSSSSWSKVNTGAHSPRLKAGIGYVRFAKARGWLGKTLTLVSAQQHAARCDILGLRFFDQGKPLASRVSL